MSTRQIAIWDNTKDEPVEATLHESLPPDTLVAVESIWFPLRLQATARLAQAQGLASVPEHWHWNWGNKSSRLQLLAYQCLGIECAGQIQNLAMVSTVGHSARLAPDAGKPLIYLEYVESAPWNLRPLTDKPLYGGLGAQTMLAIIRLSKHEGFHGRVGLHSLPQAEKFYRNVCGMTDLGPDPDPDKQGLRYFEFTREQAQAFQKKGGE